MSMQTELGPLTRTVSSMTVDKLKLTLRNISTGPLRHVYNAKITGLKAALVERLRMIVTDVINSRDVNHLDELKRCMTAGQAGLHSSPVQPSAPAAYHSAPPAYQTPAYPRAYQPPQQQVPANYYLQQQQRDILQRHQQAATASGSGSQFADRPYANPMPPAHLPPARYGIPPPAAPASALSASTKPSSTFTPGDTFPIYFKSSPFFKVEKSLTSITTCLKTGLTDKRSVTCSFGLTEAQRTLLSASKTSPHNPQYQVRLYCTSDTHYNTARAGATQLNIPIEFPEQCEIKLNQYAVPSNTKGVKKKVGSAPPVDLSHAPGMGGGFALSLAPGSVNRIEMLYAKTDKKFYLIVYLIEVSSVKSAVAKIKQAKYRSRERTIADIILLNSDQDVQATAYGLSLNDPLTFARIKTPVRASSCSHISCFDAQVFFMMNEQTPTWTCPVCNNSVKAEDIEVDGFFDHILQTCPSSIDTVIVEPDGTWRTSDGKYGTGITKQENNGTGNDKGKGKAEVSGDVPLSLDSDDEVPLAARLAPDSVVSSSDESHHNPPRPRPPAPRRSEVIDLTLSSDEEDEDDNHLHDYVPPVDDPVTVALDLAAKERVQAALLAAQHLAAAGNKRTREEDDAHDAQLAATNKRLRDAEHAAAPR